MISLNFPRRNITDGVTRAPKRILRNCNVHDNETICKDRGWDAFSLGNVTPYEHTGG